MKADPKEVALRAQPSPGARKRATLSWFGTTHGERHGVHDDFRTWNGWAGEAFKMLQEALTTSKRLGTAGRARAIIAQNVPPDGRGRMLEHESGEKPCDEESVRNLLVPVPLLTTEMHLGPAEQTTNYLTTA